MEVWDDDSIYSNDDSIDNFTVPLPSPLNTFNLSSSFTHQGDQEVGNLTLNYGYLINDPTPCSSMYTPMSSTSTQTHQGIHSTSINYSWEEY